MIVPSWIKRIAEETAANQKRFFDLFENALPRGMRNAFRKGEVNLSRRYGVDPEPAPDKNSKHPGSVLGDRIRTTRARFHLGKVEKPIMTNNQRVVARRAARMGISIHEYEKRFPRGCNG